ncbi:hypothetical protein LB505_009402 [Fusarium chuoi]|nr:hypothetical protein LB505_009402 [Fusarium chuoi]
MRPFLSIPFLTSSLLLVNASPVSRDGKDSSFNLEPFTVDLSHGVPHMLDLAKRTKLPTNGDYFDPNAGYTISLLKSKTKPSTSSTNNLITPKLSLWFLIMDGQVYF